MLADALKPYKGIVMWRAFVYSPSDADRAKQAYLEFEPLDGQFRNNVIVQVKNGPIDFQPREPYSPLFGAMQQVSGNTGTRTTGEHLHFGVKSVSADGSKRDMDPAAYLAEIGQKGNIKLQALHNGNDLLAKYKSNAPQEQKVSSEDWMKKILSSEDSGVGISGTNDPILDMA